MNFIKRSDNQLELDIFGFIRFLFGKLPIILLVGILMGVAVFGASHVLMTPLYDAKIKMYINNASAEKMTVSQSDIIASVQLVQVYGVIVLSDSVLDQVLEQEELEEEMGLTELRNKITCAAENNTNVFSVTVRDADPKKATRIANRIAEIVPDSIGEIIEGSSVKIIDMAKIPTVIASPNYIKMSAVGFLLGFILSFALILIKELADTRIRNEEDLQQWEYPVLGVVPDFAQMTKNSSGKYGN